MCMFPDVVTFGIENAIFYLIKKMGGKIQMKTKIGVKIMPREVILDTQGRAVEQTLKLNNYNVQSCRVGKFVELEIEGDEKTSMKKAEEIAKYVLHNPLIETFELKKI